MDLKNYKTLLKKQHQIINGKLQILALSLGNVKLLKINIKLKTSCLFEFFLMHLSFSQPPRKGVGIFTKNTGKHFFFCQKHIKHANQQIWTHTNKKKMNDYCWHHTPIKIGNIYSKDYQNY